MGLIKDVLEVDKNNKFVQQNSKLLTLNTILNLSPKLDGELLTEAVNDNNAELLLSGLVSLGVDYGD